MSKGDTIRQLFEFTGKLIEDNEARFKNLWKK